MNRQTNPSEQEILYRLGEIRESLEEQAEAAVSDTEKQNQLAYSLGLAGFTGWLLVLLFNFYSSRVVLQETLTSNVLDWLLKVAISITVILILIIVVSLFARGFWLAVRPYHEYFSISSDLEQKYDRVANSLFSLFLFIFSYVLNVLAISLPLVIAWFAFNQYFVKSHTGWLGVSLAFIVFLILFSVEQRLGQRFLTWIGVADFLRLYERATRIRRTIYYLAALIIVVFWSVTVFLYRLELNIPKDIFVQGVDQLVVFDLNFGGEVRDLSKVGSSVVATDIKTNNLIDQFSKIGDPSEGHLKYFRKVSDLPVGQYQVVVTYPRSFLFLSVPIKRKIDFTILPGSR